MSKTTFLCSKSKLSNFYIAPFLNGRHFYFRVCGENVSAEFIAQVLTSSTFKERRGLSRLGVGLTIRRHALPIAGWFIQKSEHMAGLLSIRLGA